MVTSCEGSYKSLKMKANIQLLALHMIQILKTIVIFSFKAGYCYFKFLFVFFKKQYFVPARHSDSSNGKKRKTFQNNIHSFTTSILNLTSFVRSTWTKTAQPPINNTVYSTSMTTAYAFTSPTYKQGTLASSCVQGGITLVKLKWLCSNAIF